MQVAGPGQPTRSRYWTASPAERGSDASESKSCWLSPTGPTCSALLSLEDRPKLLTKFRSIGVAVNVNRMHRGSPNHFFLLAADREGATGLTWHLSTINDPAWHPFLLDRYAADDGPRR